MHFDDEEQQEVNGPISNVYLRGATRYAHLRIYSLKS